MPQEPHFFDQAGWRWADTYGELPGLFYEPCCPQPVSSPRFVIFNRDLAVSLGLDSDLLAQDGAAQFFAGNRLPAGTRSIAQAYAGHQFGHFTGLGDGRAVLLGEHITPGGFRVDVQLKGSGRTRYSRGGDGRAALGPMLREYLISEAMAALGISTTRSLAVVGTGEMVQRDRPLPGAILTRVAASHIRIGTFQWAAAHDDRPALDALLHYSVGRHFPEIDVRDARAFFEHVMDRQIQLVVDWMRVGFIHGVMNTDNVAISGETMDYGPCAFMDGYDPEAVFSSIDRGGRYAFANQPSILRWNLARLAEALLPLFADERAAGVDHANERLGQFEASFQRQWLRMMRGKIGIFSEDVGDAKLIQDLLEIMHVHGLDFTRTFVMLADVLDGGYMPGVLEGWVEIWRGRLARQSQSLKEVKARMRASNPFVIPRNHLVEEALLAAETGDMLPFENLCNAVRHPYTMPDCMRYMESAPSGSPKYVTFCGT